MEIGDYIQIEYPNGTIRTGQIVKSIDKGVPRMREYTEGKPFWDINICLGEARVIIKKSLVKKVQ